MKAKLLMIIMGVLLLLAGSCKKGDTGAVGPQGEKGDAGERGIKGADGSTMHSGTVVPAASLGKNGDYYFRTTTSVLYGPKTDKGWGTGVSIKGENGKNGTNGKNGSQFLSGTSIPAVNIGAVGDFYFNTAAMVLYGPKTATGWGVGTNLKADARVLYSGWKSAVRVKDTIMDGTQLRIAHIYAPQISETVMNSAVVLVYLDYGGGPFPLPFTSRPGGRMSTIGFKLKLRELLIFRMVYDGGALLMLGSSIQYRYVIIPGNYYTALKDKQVDFGDPLAVEKAIQKLEL